MASSTPDHWQQLMKSIKQAARDRERRLSTTLPGALAAHHNQISPTFSMLAERDRWVVRGLRSEPKLEKREPPLIRPWENFLDLQRSIQRRLFLKCRMDARQFPSQSWYFMVGQTLWSRVQSRVSIPMINEGDWYPVSSFLCILAQDERFQDEFGLGRQQLILHNGFPRGRTFRVYYQTSPPLGGGLASEPTALVQMNRTPLELTLAQLRLALQPMDAGT
jgi:hypothetical protein